MNNHGAILDDFGLGPMMDTIMRECVQPLARVAGYADVVGGECRLLSHHAFIGESRALTLTLTLTPNPP